MAEYSYCVNANHIPQELLCDTDRYIGNNATTIAVDTNANVSSKTQSPESSDLATPKLCNRVDNTTDLDIVRSNNRNFDRLQYEINILDINKNNPGIKIDISEDPVSGLGSVENSVNNRENGKVRFGLNSYEEYDASPDSEKTILDDNVLKMEDSVFKEELLTKAKSESNLDSYGMSVTKLRKISPSGLTSPSSTTSLSADIKSVCRRKHSSGSDVGRRSRPVSEEIFASEDEVTEEELPPCDCDECLFNPVEERPKPPPEDRKMVKKV